MRVNDPADPSVVALRFDVHAVAEDLAHFCDGEAASVDGHECINVPTESGIQFARRGDWIVRLSEGHFLVMSPEEFAARFEPHPEGTAV